MACITRCWTDPVARAQGARCLVHCYTDAQTLTVGEARVMIAAAVADHERRFIVQAMLVASIAFALTCISADVALHPQMVSDLLAYWG